MNVEFGWGLNSLSFLQLIRHTYIVLEYES